MGAVADTSQVVRVAIGESELRELRELAARRGVKLPALLGQLVKRELESSRAGGER